MADELHDRLAEARAVQHTLAHRVTALEGQAKELLATIAAMREQHHALDVWRATVEPEIATVRSTTKSIVDRATTSVLLLAGGAGVAAVLSELIKSIKGGQ